MLNGSVPLVFRSTRGMRGRRADEKQFLVLFHQAILENDLPTITNMYESGWNKLTQVSRMPLEGSYEKGVGM